MRVGFIVERRYLRQEITEAVVGLLRQRDVHTDILCPQDCHLVPESGAVQVDGGGSFDLRSYDAIVSRSRNGLGLAMLAYAESEGIPAVNAAAAIRRARNKVDVALALGPAGVPCAPTVLADSTAVLARLGPTWFPLILKSTYGDNSQGLRLVRRPEDLQDLTWGDEVVLAQRYLPNGGVDLKLYVCGDSVFATRKPSPFNGDPRQCTEPIEPDGRMVELARRCGDVLGLEIFGVDAIETPEGPQVIEVNEFPNFTHVPGAAEHIAAYLLDRVLGRRARRGIAPADFSAFAHERGFALPGHVRAADHAYRLSAALA